MSNIMPEPNGQRCIYCGKPIQNHEACVATKAKRGGYWNFAHMRCAYPKTKEADKGVRLK